ncbi:MULTISPECIES: helicase HerA-like domain-containing protein [unclassified Flavobacterium]|uniref:helicase HerA-like domain-containing protein n=1 Tax=unclassified Flavobacterium TaxID=196869 RepID=UPI00057DA098|nr:MULTISPECIES: helicase HerA-like domain-containing protein [unclassified Flavobacterium]KIA98695.1 ATPase [Flavobacterium sp. KMS]KIC02548.1 ATPase [Flavobacterium sp. JRM]OUL61354.1 ATPase [Flavobacterium sp. AJR]
MSQKDEFIQSINDGYQTKGESIILGGAIFDGEPLNAHVKIPLKTLNRHGLIAGATGTGKTKTIQVLSEQLSLAGIPVLMMDIKGDFSGIAKEGEEKSFITERHAKIDIPYNISQFPVELMSLSEQSGVRLRATVSEFGPVLFSRILGLNDTQSGVISVIFKYCDDNKMPLLDLKDIKKVINYITEEGKDEIAASYGKISTATTGTILRKIIELEQQGADIFFGELSFEIDDLMRIDENGKGYVNIIRLTDIQDKPKLFSTFMLSLLAEIYQQMPEKGDVDQPELVIFIDEAHLIFNEASKVLLEQIETIVKLIRSKGVGVYFVTQNPMDVPSGVLAQLGLKIQHALRAFTANDRQAIKKTADNYPTSKYYKTDELLTSLGIGEALVTALNEKGVPTPLVATMMRAPMSRMDVLTESEIQEINQKSKLVKKYSEVIDRESAYEILTKKISDAEQEASSRQEEKTSQKTSNEPSTASVVGKSVLKVVTSATFIRGVFGVLSKMFKK